MKSAILIGFLFAVSKCHRDISSIGASPGQFADPSLKFVAVIFRHGNRSPVFKYKTDPHANAFPEGSGQLTKMGKQCMYKKGQLFRRLYNGFISDLYLDNEILIKTTRLSRTYMSAAMVVAGMYPPINYQKWSDIETVWQPIPIHNDSPDHGDLFSRHGKCPSFNFTIRKLTSQFLYDSNITKPLLMFLSKKCGEPIHNINLRLLHDLFLCQIAEGLQLPEWIKPHHIETMKSITFRKENLKLLFGNPKIQYFLIGPLLKNIVSEIKLRSSINIFKHSKTRKMHLYSSHDVSIKAAMVSLKTDDTIDLPDFGASLHFHLYLNETVGYYIKIFYYDRWSSEKEEELTISHCGNPCKVQDFLNLINDRYSGEWKDECEKVDTD